MFQLLEPIQLLATAVRGNFWLSHLEFVQNTKKNNKQVNKPEVPLIAPFQDKQIKIFGVDPFGVFLGHIIVIKIKVTFIKAGFITRFFS